MIGSGIAVIAAACLFGFTPQLAAPAAAQEQADLRSVAFLSGSCERMMVAGRDESGTCRGPVTNIVYDSGRISFAFPNDAGVLVSFSGTDQWMDGDRISLRLDRITVATETSPAASSESSEGICEFGDFFAGAVTIRCAGAAGSGDYIGIFSTDGKAPNVERF